MVDDGRPIGGCGDHALEQGERTGGSFLRSGQPGPCPAATFSTGGEYVLRLTADDSELIGIDDVTFTVTGNRPPVVDAGTNQSIGLTIPAAPPVFTNPSMIIPDDWIYDMAMPGLDVTNFQFLIGVNRHSIAVEEGNVYVAGWYDVANGAQVNGLGVWAGCEWSGLMDARIGFARRGSTMGPLDSLGTNVFTGGGFLNDLADPPDGNGDWLGRWDGAGWREWLFKLTLGVVSINDIEVYSNAVYVGGFFRFQPIINGAPGHTPIPGLPESHSVAKWNGVGSEVLSNGVTYSSGGPADVFAVAAAPNGDLFAGGRFDMNTPYGVANNMVWWDGTEWRPMGSGITRSSGTPEVKDIAVDALGNVYVCGRFTHADGLPVK